MINVYISIVSMHTDERPRDIFRVEIEFYGTRAEAEELAEQLKSLAQKAISQ